MDSPQKTVWKTLQSEYLYNEPWLTLRKDRVELPNGHIVPEYYVFEYPDWVNVIAITRDHQFVLISQYRHGLGVANYELCAGVRDPEDATPLEAAKRELLEETGYGNGNWEEFMVISANPATTNNLTYCFLATDVEQISPPAPEDSEDISVHLFSIDEVKKLLEQGEIMQALHAAPLWKLMATHHAF